MRDHDHVSSPPPLSLAALCAVVREQRGGNLAFAPEVPDCVLQPYATAFQKSIQIVARFNTQEPAKLEPGQTMCAVSFHGYVFESLARRIQAFGNDLPGEFVRDAYGYFHVFEIPDTSLANADIPLGRGRSAPVGGAG